MCVGGGGGGGGELIFLTSSNFPDRTLSVYYSHIHACLDVCVLGGAHFPDKQQFS